MELTNLLCPIDYSAASDAALEQAAKLARRHNATLHIIHTYELTYVDAYTEGMATLPVAADTKALRQRLTDYRPTGVKVVHELIFGIPASVIVHYAAKNEIDLVVMGAKSQSRLGRFLFGSATEAVMRVAPCPVLAVHAAVAAEFEKESGLLPNQSPFVR